MSVGRAAGTAGGVLNGGATHAEAPGMRLTLLRLVLIARCLVSLGLVWTFESVKPSTPPAIVTAFAPYAFLDGVLALIVAALAIGAGWRKGIAAVAMAGGLIRVTAALAIWYGPGIPYFAVTFVLYVGLLATLGFLVGLLELGEATRLWGDAGWRPLSAVLALEGCATVLLAIVAFFTRPQPTTITRLLVAGAVLEAFALLAVALQGAVRPRLLARAHAVDSP